MKGRDFWKLTLLWALPARTSHVSYDKDLRKKKKTRHPYDSGTGVVEESDPCEVNPKNFP